MDIYDTPLTEMEKLEQLEEDARQKRIDYLRKKGWKHSSNYPCCTWLWENEKLNIRGCDFSTAWRIEAHSGGRATFSQDHVIKPHGMPQHK